MVSLLDFDRAIELFNELQKKDPYSLDQMDTYSNILYVKVMTKQTIHMVQVVMCNL